MTNEQLAEDFLFRIGVIRRPKVVAELAAIFDALEERGFMKASWMGEEVTTPGVVVEEVTS